MTGAVIGVFLSTNAIVKERRGEVRNKNQFRIGLAAVILGGIVTALALLSRGS